MGKIVEKNYKCQVLVDKVYLALADKDYKNEYLHEKFMKSVVF